MLDINNIIQNLNFPAVIMDKNLKLMATNSAYENQISQQTEFALLAELKKQTLNSFSPVDVHIQSSNQIATISASEFDENYILFIHKIAPDLRKTANAFFSIVENSPNGILVHKNGEVLYANKQMANLLGFSSAPDLIGLNFSQYMTSQDQLLQQAITVKEKDFFEWEKHSRICLLRKDGTSQWVDALSCFYEIKGQKATLLHMRDITEQITLESRLEKLAKQDTLTGLPNRLYITEYLEKSIKLANTMNYEASLLFIDLNGFKKVNDELGHHAGDEFIKAIAQRFKSVLRSEDVIGRLGGDEFVVVLNKTSKDLAYQVCDRLLQSLKEAFIIEGKPVYAGAAIGVSFYPTYAKSTDELLNQADEAMYEAKARKGNIFVDYVELSTK